MGELLLAAKVTHVPSMFISEQPGPHHGCRAAAIEGLRRIGQLCRERGVDTVVIADTHWLVNAGYHINANPVMEGVFTSTEFPQSGVKTLCHSDVPTLNLQYGTLVPLRYMEVGEDIKVVSVAGWMYDAELEESKTVGESILEAVKASDRGVAFLASGSLSHRIPPNAVVDDYLFRISRPFNEQVDLHVLEMWQAGRTQQFLDMLPQYAADCSGEGHMHDTAMLFGLLGWDTYEGRAEVLTDYFPSSGTGQCNVVFPVSPP
jgi:3,4-dihydroxyphenylacetate 2,3-dioxygenase